MKRTDFVGLILAAACVVHCLAMPLVLVYLPVLGMSWLTDSRVHYALLGAGLTLGGCRFCPAIASTAECGFRRWRLSGWERWLTPPSIRKTSAATVRPRIPWPKSCRPASWRARPRKLAFKR